MLLSTYKTEVIYALGKFNITNWSQPLEPLKFKIRNYFRDDHA